MRLVAMALAVLVSAALTGQDSIRLANLVERAVSSAVLREGNGNFDKFRAPLFRRYEFRTETNDFEPEAQEYTLRLSPMNEETRYRQRELAAYLGRKPTQRDCGPIEDAYEDWIDLLETDERSRLLERQLTLARDRQSLYEKYAARLDADLDDLLSARTAIADLKRRLDRAATRRRGLLAAHGLPDAPLAADGTFALPAIRAEVPALADRPLVDKDEAADRYDLGLIEREIALERAEAKNYFDFAQVRYRGPREDDLGENLSIGVGLQLRTEGSRNLKIRELETERLETEAELADQRAELARDRSRETGSLEAELDYLARLETSLAEEEDYLARLLTFATSAEAFDPELVLDIATRRVDNQLRLVVARYAVRRSYLRVLEAGGELCGALTD